MFLDTLVYVLSPLFITILLLGEMLVVVLVDDELFSIVASADLGLRTYSSFAFMRPVVGFVTLEP